MLALGLVLPGKEAALPDVDEAEIALGAARGGADDFNVLFKAVVLAGGVGLRRRGLVEEVAEVEEVLDARLALVSWAFDHFSTNCSGVSGPGRFAIAAIVFGR